MFANDDFNSFNVLPNNPTDFTAPVDSSVIVLNIILIMHIVDICLIFVLFKSIIILKGE